MIAVTGVAILGLAAAQYLPQAAQGTGRPAIRLQVVSTVPLPDPVLETVIDQAAAIWAPYGVTVTATRQLVRPPDSHGEWITLIIREAARLEPSRAVRDGRRQLASLVFTAGVPGTLMTASWNVAREMADGAGARGEAVSDRLAARLLGRAVAHEIGHYLLGTRDHAPRGLMRVAFTVRDVLGGDRSGILLEPAQIRALDATSWPEDRRRAAGTSAP
jgi:hypothetical protein